MDLLRGFSGPVPVGRRGFTLIELLVTVGIVGVLVVLAVPRFEGALRKAETAHCKTNLLALGQALTEYKIEYGSYPLADGTAGEKPSPEKTSYGNGPAACGYWSGVPWELLEKGYVTTRDVFYCPTLLRLHPDGKDQLRYAYNYGAADMYGSWGGEDDLEAGFGDKWLLKCLHENCESFDPERAIDFPHRLPTGEMGEHCLFMNTRVELVRPKR